MQLDRVRGDARLAMLEIEERDADDARLRAEPQLLPCLSHLPAPIRRRPARTRRRGRLRDHLLGPRLENEVEILVRLVPDERHGRVDAEDMPLERKPRRRQRRWSLVATAQSESNGHGGGADGPAASSPSSARRRRLVPPSTGNDRRAMARRCGQRRPRARRRQRRRLFGARWARSAEPAFAAARPAERGRG
jgi:hypothetical protein